MSAAPHSSLRVAIIGLKGLPAKGGGERAGEAIVTYLGDRHRFSVYCDRSYTPEGAQVGGARLIRFAVPAGKHLRMFTLDLLAACHALFAGRYDLVHLHNVETGFVAPLLRLRYPVVGTSQARSYTADKWGRLARAFMWFGEQLMVRTATRMTCVTPLLAPYYARFGPVAVVPNGADPDVESRAWAPGRAAAAHGLTPGRFVLFAAGRIIPLKGCHTLLEAWSSLDTGDELVIVGDLDHLPAYGRTLRDLAGPRVRFIPFVSDGQELFGLVRDSRFFVFPSTNEAMSLMLLEVAALGVPLVCSDIPPNQVVLGDHGYYFTAGDASDLASKMAGAFSDPGTLRERARSARSAVLERHDWSRIATEYESIYFEALGRPAPRRGAALQPPSPPAGGVGRAT